MTKFLQIVGDNSGYWGGCGLQRGWTVFRIGLVLALLSCRSQPLCAQETSDYFRQNCMSCHTIGGGRLTGPDLKDVTQRKDREWLANFMMNPRVVLDSGDPYAKKLLEESRNVPMPTLPGLNRERADKLLDLIEAESKLEKSQFQGVKISSKPFTDADRQLGRDIFLGRARLSGGGAACLSCHSIHGVTTLGGGRLGPDLTNVYERLKGRQSLSAWLMAPSTETMQPIFKNHPLTGNEIQGLAAYFEASAGETPVDPATQRTAFLLLGLLGATAMVLACDTIWKRRFYSVRKVLVDSVSPRGV